MCLKNAVVTFLKKNMCPESSLNGGPNDQWRGGLKGGWGRGNLEKEDGGAFMKGSILPFYNAGTPYGQVIWTRAKLQGVCSKFSAHQLKHFSFTKPTLSSYYFTSSFEASFGASFNVLTLSVGLSHFPGGPPTLPAPSPWLPKPSCQPPDSISWFTQLLSESDCLLDSGCSAQPGMN